MYGLKKSPNSSINTNTNPFDSDDELDNKQPSIKTSGRTSSEPSLLTSNVSTNPFDDCEVKGHSPSKRNLHSAAKNRYKNDFHDAGGLEKQSVQELENYAVHKAEETTKTVNDCLKLAEEIREDATKTLVTLHQQGEQITRTHMVAADIDHDLSRVYMSCQVFPVVLLVCVKMLDIGSHQKAFDLGARVIVKSRLYETPLSFIV